MTHQRPASHTPSAGPAGPLEEGSPAGHRDGLLARRGLTGDRGMTTAEYAVGTVAACGFGAVLYKAVTSDAVARLLRGVREQALSVSFL